MAAYRVSSPPDTQPPQKKIPAYGLHKASGRAVVYLNRRTIYLGEYGTKASLSKYAQLVEQWNAGGAHAIEGRGHFAEDLTVAELVAHMYPLLTERYAAAELSAFAVATRRLLRLYADTRVADFGTVALQTVRSAMIQDGLCRNVVNASVHRIRRLWRLGVIAELVTEAQWNTLKALPALRKGEHGVRESEAVRPATVGQIRAVLRHAPEMVQLMAKLQLLTGMRPGEVTIMRPCDIDTSSGQWIYTPSRHKTQHLDKSRQILLGPRARRALQPTIDPLLDAPDTFLFNPRYALADYNARRRSSHKRPEAHTPARRRQRNRQRGVQPRTCNDHYTPAAYRKAVRRACELAYPLPDPIAREPKESVASWKLRIGETRWQEVEQWRRDHICHPHQFRHNFATRINRLYNADASRILLGHSDLRVTDIYIERDLQEVAPMIEIVG